MRELAARTQQIEGTPAREAIERPGREVGAEGMERAQVEQTLQQASAEIERLNGQLAEAEALTAQMADVPPQVRTELAALRVEADTARARLAGVAARKTTLDAGRGGIARAPEASATPEAPAQQLLEQERTRDLSAEEQASLANFTEMVKNIDHETAADIPEQHAETVANVQKVHDLERDLDALNNDPVLLHVVDYRLRQKGTRLKPTDREWHETLQKEFGARKLIDANLTAQFSDRLDQRREKERKRFELTRDLLTKYRGEVVRDLPGLRETNLSLAAEMEQQVKGTDSLLTRIDTIFSKIVANNDTVEGRRILQLVRRARTKINNEIFDAQEKLITAPQAGGMPEEEAEARVAGSRAETRYIGELKKLAERLKQEYEPS